MNKRIDRTILESIRGKSEKETISLILYTNHEDDEKMVQVLSKYNVSVKYKLKGINAIAVEIPAININKVARLKDVKYIENDTKVDMCLNVARASIGAEYAHGLGYDGRGICIAVLDTGLYPHNDIMSRKNGKVKAFVDFIGAKSRLYDDNGHGTHVCGIIASNGLSSNGKYMGIAPGADLVVIKVMDKNGGGMISDIAAGIEWIIEHKEQYNIRIVSMSLGVDGRLGRNDALLKEAERLWDHGIAVFVAAGNNGPERKTINVPGISPKLITVGCVDDLRTIQRADDVVAEFSSRGPARKTVKPDVVAPGVDIISLKNQQKQYIKMSGTSMSTPMAAGIAALMLQKKSDLTPQRIKDILMKNTYSLGEDKNSQGKGELDMVKILSQI
jgi:serine protease AprX